MSAGGLILVVGPSGAGKDSLLRAAVARFGSGEDFVFPRRVITREVDAATEDHESLSRDEFEKALSQGAFALHWEAHGLHYGVPAAMRGDIEAGRCVVVNVSRGIIAQAMAQFPRLAVIEVTAPTDVLMERLSGRHRQTDGDLGERVVRKVDPYPAGVNLVSICNDGVLEDAEQAFIAALQRMRGMISSMP